MDRQQIGKCMQFTKVFFLDSQNSFVDIKKFTDIRVADLHSVGNISD